MPPRRYTFTPPLTSLLREILSLPLVLKTPGRSISFSSPIRPTLCVVVLRLFSYFIIIQSVLVCITTFSAQDSLVRVRAAVRGLRQLFSQRIALLFLSRMRSRKTFCPGQRSVSGWRFGAISCTCWIGEWGEDSSVHEERTKSGQVSPESNLVDGLIGGGRSGNNVYLPIISRG